MDDRDKLEKIKKGIDLLSDNERKGLAQSLYNEIDKINEIDLEVNDTLISPSDIDCKLSSDEGVVFENPKVFIDNAPKKFDSFIEIGGVFNE